MSSSNEFNIEHFKIGEKHPCFIIAEIGQNHDGSLGMAHAFIDAVAKTGADAIKFQTHIASEESTKEEPWRVKFSYEDETRYDYWKRMEFSPEQWKGIADHCKQQNLVFLSSPFSVKAVDLLNKLSMPAWKIASGEVSNSKLISVASQTNKPIIISTGMSPLDEITQAVEIVNNSDNAYAILQCTSAYPCPPEKIGLNMLKEFREKYESPVGLSDHTGEIYAGLAAATLRCDILESHVTLSNEMFGPDISTSITTSEFKTMVKGIRYIETIHNNPIDKNNMAIELQPLRDLFTKSLVAKKDIIAGSKITENMIIPKKPGTGIPEQQIKSIIGRTAKISLQKDTILKFEYFS